jgi:hypothetical protein
VLIDNLIPRRVAEHLKHTQVEQSHRRGSNDTALRLNKHFLQSHESVSILFVAVCDFESLVNDLPRKLFDDDDDVECVGDD